MLHQKSLDQKFPVACILYMHGKMFFTKGLALQTYPHCEAIRHLGKDTIR